LQSAKDANWLLIYCLDQFCGVTASLFVTLLCLWTNLFKLTGYKLTDKEVPQALRLRRQWSNLQFKGETRESEQIINPQTLISYDEKDKQ